MTEPQHPQPVAKPVRKCKTPNCYTKPPAKSLYCLACELDGHAPLIRVPRVS